MMLPGLTYAEVFSLLRESFAFRAEFGNRPLLGHSKSKHWRKKHRKRTSKVRLGQRYAPNGKRECARRVRQAQRVAARAEAARDKDARVRAALGIPHDRPAVIPESTAIYVGGRA